MAQAIAGSSLLAETESALILLTISACSMRKARSAGINCDRLTAARNRNSVSGKRKKGT